MSWLSGGAGIFLKFHSVHIENVEILTHGRETAVFVALSGTGKHPRYNIVRAPSTDHLENRNQNQSKIRF